MICEVSRTGIIEARTNLNPLKNCTCDHNSAVVVVRVVTQVLPLQEHVNLPEGGPLLLLPPPTLAHEIAHLPRARVRGRQAGGGCGGCGGCRLAASLLVEEGQIRDDFIVRQRLERLRPGVSQYLPERHSKRPDVALRREFSLEIGDIVYEVP